ncbi:MAG: hypothetical protein ABJQ29_15195 [Luteolibacter sp.]
MLLFQTRNLGYYADQQKNQRWSLGGAEVIALGRKTILVGGIGGIGT